MTKQLTLAIAVVGAFTAGMLVSLWMQEPQTPIEPALEAEPVASPHSRRVGAASTSERARTKPRTQHTETLIAKLSTEGSNFVRDVLEGKSNSQDRMQVLTLAATLYPQTLYGLNDLIQADEQYTNLLTGLGYAYYPSDSDTAAALLNIALDEEAAAEAILYLQAEYDNANVDDHTLMASTMESGKRVNYNLVTRLQRIMAMNPAEALALVARHPNPSVGRDWRNAALREWAASDAASAADWLVSQPDAEILRSQLQTLASLWGKSDFHAAQQFAQRLDGSNRTQYLRRLASHAARNDDVRLSEFLQQYEGSDVYPAVVSSAAQSLGNRNPDAALELLEQLPASDTHIALASIVRERVSNSRDEAYEWWSSLAADKQSATREQLAISLAGFGDARAVELVQQISDAQERNKALHRIGMMFTNAYWHEALPVIDLLEPGGRRQDLLRAVIQRMPSDSDATALGQREGMSTSDVMKLRSSG